MNKVPKQFRNAPNCFVMVHPLNDEGKPQKDVTKKMEGKYLGTVREFIEKGSFITAFDVALIFMFDESRLTKVELNQVQFEKE